MNGAAFLLALASAGAAAAAAAATAPQAGLWLHQTKLVGADIPGVPSAVIWAQPAPGPRTSCLTARQSASDPQILFFAPDALCSTRRYNLLADGRVRGTSVCRVDRLENPVKTTTTGTYSATGYRTRSVTTGTRNGRPLRIVSTASGRWIGAGCK